MEKNIYNDNPKNIDYMLTRKDVEIFHKIETKKQVTNILINKTK